MELAGLDGRVALSARALADLESRIGGRVVRPGDTTWGHAVSVWNAMVARSPALVLQPMSSRDVAEAVRFARAHGLLLGIKGGGHHIAGTAIAEHGLTLDMSQMRDVVVDPDTKLVRVAPGCLLRDVDRATQEHGLATVLGFISEVGVAGLTLGGGLGYLTRRFGWTVDNLVEVEIVTADGEIRIASREEDPDLFWALRGGGGNFGVVTRFTFGLHEVGPQVYGGLIAWPFQRADEILGAYQRLTRDAPPTLSVWLVLLRAPAAPFVPGHWHGKRVCGMVVCYSGPLRRVDEVTAPIRSLGDPVVDLLQPQPYTQIQSFLDATEPRGRHYYWKTEYLTELSEGLLATLRDLFADCPMPDGDIGILHLAGALNEREDDDGAVGNRDARFVVGIKGMWAPHEPGAAAFQRWVRDAGKEIRRFSAGRTYINFQTADEGDDGIRATYGANYDRLARIKRAYDPGNLFRVNRNVRPAD